MVASGKSEDSLVVNTIRDMMRLLGIVILAGMLFGVSGCGGGGDTGTDTGTTTTASGPSEDDSTEEPGGALMAPGLQMGGGMSAAISGGMPTFGGPMGGPMGGPAAGAPAGPGWAAGGGAAGPKVTTKPPNARPDPFAPWWSTTPPPPPAITLVEPYRIATREAGVKPVEETVEVQEVPNRRVAGIATGAGVYALVEGPEGQSVVKAGDMLGDYRVESIRSRSIVLTRKVGNVSYTQEVPLTDVGSQRTAAPAAPGGPGGAGMMFRGGGPPRMGGGGGGVGAESEL